MSSLKVPGEPNRPSLTPAMIGAALLAGIPVIANLLHVFGVYTLSPDQQDALTSTMQWALGGAGVLAGADAYLRGKRNDAHASVVSTAHMYDVPTSAVPEGNVDPEQPGEQPGEEAPPEALLYPLADPEGIPPDEGDAQSEGSA